MNMRKCLFILGITAVIYTGCAGPKELSSSLEINTNYAQDVKKIARLTHNVVLAPVRVETPTTAKPNEKYAKLDPGALANQLIEAFQIYNVFDKIEKLPANLTAKKDQIAEARNKEATLIMNLSIKYFRIYYISGSDATMSNTLLWFLGTIPCFWTHDQLYGVEINAEASFLDLATSEEFALPLTSYTTTFKEEGGLSFLERGFNVMIFILPPQMCSANWDAIDEFISPKATAYFLVKLAEQTKKELQK